MKKTLSLVLSFTISSLGLFALAAKPARAQQVASAGASINKIREEYERLLAVDRDPSTASDVRELNRKFLEERRAQLRAAIETRLGALREYQSSMSGTLSTEEGVTVGDSIQSLKRDLAALKNDDPPARVERKARSSSSTPRARLVTASAARRAPAAKPEMETVTAAPDVRADAGATAPDPAPEPRREDPIEISSPSADTPISVDKVELEITLHDKTINNVMVAVYTEGVEKPFGARLVEFLRSEDSKKVPIGLRKGDNRIEVTSSQLPTAKAVRKLKYTPGDAIGISGGGGVGSAGNALGVTGVTLSSGTPKWMNVPEAGDNVRVGYKGDADKLYQFFVVKKDGTTQNVGEPTMPGVSGTVSAVFPELASGDTVGVVQMENNSPVGGTRDSIQVEAESDGTQGSPFGLLVGGVVMSQQAQEFQQSDPFFGFIAGYNFRVRSPYAGSKKCGTGRAEYWQMADGSYADKDGYTVICMNDTLLYKPSDGTAFVAKPTKPEDMELMVRNTKKRKLNGSFGASRMHVRFQGLFQADPRKAVATATATPESGAATQENTCPDNEPCFIASRKTFDIEMHWWQDFWANNLFTIGPYAAIGASTVLSSNELQGETVTTGGSNDTGGATTLGTNAKSDNDIKKYWEVGILSNTALLSRKLFIQSIVGYGKYEALEGLYERKPGCWTCDTRNRFIGKLRIFPSGLSMGFGRQIQAAPMFGVDLNAGRGEDHLKFFSGFAIAIKGFSFDRSAK